MEISTPTLRMFCRVAELGSYTQAADDLYFTQPNVSAQMTKLEKSVGMVLFEQLGRQVHLTEAGELFYQHAQKILQQVEEADEALSDLRGDSVGRLRIGAVERFGTYVLPSALQRFQCRRERIQINLVVANTEQIVDGILRNRLDVGIAPGPLNHPELEIRRIHADKLVLIVGQHHPWYGRAEITLQELAGQPYISREKGSTLRSVTEREIAKLGFQLRIAMEMNNTDAIIRAVATGEGVSIVSDYAIKENGLFAQLRTLDVAGLDLRLDFELFFHKDKHQTPLMKTFVQFIEETVAAADRRTDLQK